MDKLSATLRAEITARPTKTILRDSSQYTRNQFDGLPKAMPERTNIDIPDSFDGRVVWKGLLSEVMNQGSCGSCWAFASTSTLADRFNIQSLGLMNIQLSPTKLILCDFQGREFTVLHPDTNPEAINRIDTTNLSTNACMGNTLYDAWRYMYVIGTNSAECIPYAAGLEGKKNFTGLDRYNKQDKLPLCANIAGEIGDMCSDVAVDIFTGEEYGTPARFYRCLHFYSIAGIPADGGSEYNIRHNIFCWGPISTGMNVYEDFYDFDAKTEIYEWNGKGKPVGGHAIEIVGWGEEKNKKYWIVKNSWGKHWGRGGYFYMARGNNNCKIEENIITGVPDFFYPLGFELQYKDIWAENPKAIEERREISAKLNITGGGIDPSTGYTRRVMISKPWVNLARPVYLGDLPTPWKDFVAGIDAAPKRRYKYQRHIHSTHMNVTYNKQPYYITMTVLAVLILLLTITVVYFVLIKK
jgi:cathepsin B